MTNKKKFFTYLFLVILIVLTIWSLLQMSNIADVPKLLVNANKVFILLAVLCMAGFVILDALIMQSISQHSQIPVSFGPALRYAMIGQYYCMITPLASGAQPAQIYSMTVKGNYSVAQASSVLFTKFVLYQTVVGLYVLGLFIIRGHYFDARIGNLAILLGLGLAINLVALAAIFLLVFNQRILLAAVLGLLGLIQKAGWGKKITRESIIAQVNLFSSYLAAMKRNLKMLAGAAFLTGLQLTFYFSVTYYVYRSLHVTSATYFDVLTIQGLIYMAYHFIPTPGNVGVAEGGFVLFFGVLFPHPTILAAVILWRFIVYYLNLLAGGMVTLYEFLWIGKPAAVSDR
jgi:glycosyltransferase 2 family protein